MYENCILREYCSYSLAVGTNYDLGAVAAEAGGAAAGGD